MLRNVHDMCRHLAKDDAAFYRITSISCLLLLQKPLVLVRYLAVALFVDGVFAAVELDVVAVVVGGVKEPGDIAARAVAVRRRPAWVAHTLDRIVSQRAAGRRDVVVAATVQEVPAVMSTT